ncbi:MmpS family transport accessory protein [Mycobacterium aquaticum]|uniref:Mycobacterium membrane protein n=1 Tax=Mycobacterium aquaticum TaxID=1927124 RepID=A0A1X0B301_9MYCO|nr:MmpS family transport accessory protein [Mycobacterium aquaticum]ORA36585.1 hypothetical protein BST13_11510 [Mycobacterium aquaticum]
MTDSPRREGSDPTQPLGSGYPVDYPEPAYADQPPYQPPGYPAVPNSMSNPTQQLPPYPSYGYGPNATGQYGTGYPPPGQPPEPEPDDDGPRMWLWILAAVAVLLVVGLVIALVIINSSQQETVVAPPVSPQPSATTTRSTPTTTSRTPSPTVAPPITTPTSPTTSSAPGATDTVTYSVTGEGRAINITYIDTGNMLQTEFNVMLPWSKQVELPQPASQSASITIINFGPQISCSVTVNGVQTVQRTGTGLTVCAGAAP